MTWEDLVLSPIHEILPIPVILDGPRESLGQVGRWLEEVSGTEGLRAWWGEKELAF